MVGLINFFFSLVCVNLKPSFLSKLYAELDTNFRVYSRSLLTLACSLHRARELRCLFVELTQVLEVWRQAGWTSIDVEMFLNSYMKCALDMDVLREADLKQTWERYMKVIIVCLNVMYSN